MALDPAALIDDLCVIYAITFIAPMTVEYGNSALALLGAAFMAFFFKLCTILLVDFYVTIKAWFTGTLPRTNVPKSNGDGAEDGKDDNGPNIDDELLDNVSVEDMEKIVEAEENEDSEEIVVIDELEAIQPMTNGGNSDNATANDTQQDIDDNNGITDAKNTANVEEIHNADRDTDNEDDGGVGSSSTSQPIGDNEEADDDTKDTIPDKKGKGRKKRSKRKLAGANGDPSEVQPIKRWMIRALQDGLDATPNKWHYECEEHRAWIYKNEFGGRNIIYDPHGLWDVRFHPYQVSYRLRNANMADKVMRFCQPILEPRDAPSS